MADKVGILDVAVNAITVGARHRKDVGDLDRLARSIDKMGLLQPITVTPDWVLVCGWRRLEAAKKLGWDSIRAWVRPGMSAHSVGLLAERDENFLHEAYKPSEQAALFREIKTVLQQEASRRQSEFRFGGPSGGDAGPDEPTDVDGETDYLGSGHWPSPKESGAPGESREQAALIVTGQKSYKRLERLGTLMDLAEDMSQPESIRNMAAESMARIDDGHKVLPEYEKLQAALAELRPAPKQPDDAPAPTGGRSKLSQPGASLERARVPRVAMRWWVMTWRSIAGWTERYDPAVLGPAASDADWQTFRDALAESHKFARAAEEARQRADTPGDQTLFDAADTVDESANNSPDDATEPDLAQVIPIGARS